MIRELPTGRGFADIVFLPLPSCKKPALVIELKYNKSAVTAIQQIKDWHYTQALKGIHQKGCRVESAAALLIVPYSLWTLNRMIPLFILSLSCPCNKS